MSKKIKIAISSIGFICLVVLTVIVVLLMNNNAKYAGKITLEITSENDQVFESKVIKYGEGESLVDIIEKSNYNFVFEESQFGKYVVSIKGIVPREKSFGRFLSMVNQQHRELVVRNLRIMM